MFWGQSWRSSSFVLGYLETNLQENHHLCAFSHASVFSIFDIFICAKGLKD